MPRSPYHTTIARPPRRGRKYFTAEEANQSLPYVSRVVDDITACYTRAVEIRRAIEHGRPAEGMEALKNEYEQAMDRLNMLIEELHAVGVELKDFERGLLDFPSVYQDREVYLCWQRGEASVSSWHEVDAGYGGRQDITVMREAA